jgi:hypothetical protein
MLKNDIMKDFMFIFRGGMPGDMTPEQSQAAMQKWFDWINKLKTQGRYVAGDPLLPSGKSLAGKKPMVTDGPFAEGKELIGGYFIIKAASLDEATKLAHDGYPDFETLGSVEVREIMKIPMA